nr:MAG TPA: hypothetical protein [Caudoviricetes sp.]
MVKIIIGDDWCEVADNDKLIYEGHVYIVRKVR